MDELLTQFLIESRELVDQVGENLAALERDPNDAQPFDDAFRGFHTLKGGAGIVEFEAMQTALHCAEDALAAVRAESRTLSQLEIGNCLRCLDQVAEWLDTIEASGAVPADADAAEIVELFAGAGTTRVLPPRSVTRDWVEALSSAHAALAASAQTALRYRPAADAFFRHEDPLGRVAALPGLLALEVTPREPWPRLEELDPFSCNLSITALLAQPSAQIAAALGAEARHCEIEPLVSRPRADDESMAMNARKLLAAQLELLEASDGAHQTGRVASAGLVAANVLRYVGRSAEAEAVETAAAVSIAESRLEPLVEAVRAAAHAAPEPSVETEALRRHEAGYTLRVRADRIDALVRLTGELIVSKNAIGHAVRLAEHEGASSAAALKGHHAVLDRLVNELQRAVVGMRVLPLRVAFQRFPRLIRELSAELGKPATLFVEGEETEADKAIVEPLVEPLVHVLRNALGHGVEERAVREAAGKPPIATLKVSAAREGDSVVVEIADDGAGIDIARLKQVAQARNLLTPEAAAGLSDEQALNLIFLPGLSTAAAVTELSGRGVGMDAVRSAVARLGGHVDVRTVLGRGTTVRFTLPFSILVTQVMTVEAGGQLFGIPLDAVVETLRVNTDDVFAIGSARAIVLRDRTVPLIRLADLLSKPAPSLTDTAGPVVIAALDGQLGAVQVDRIGERMDVILKPLDRLLAGVPGLAGSALLGDGSVLLVLDLKELVQ